ncbi:MAG: c-type cytochrome [Planctomycetota bacterium]
MRLALTVVLVSSALADLARAEDVRAQFLLHCASCHGETGDGRGSATLDRPARSFRDGGFSYGNTPEAIYRTITHGIPGTPMPAAPSVLTEAERHALAEFVLSLGPPTVTASAAESRLVVRDRPLIARGKLPPVAPDLPERPRGLLVGTPDGLTFEYRTDDVRLLCVRQGEFADRHDWRGRGGSVLEPLGVPIHLYGGGDPGPSILHPDGRPFTARLYQTSIEGSRALVRYRLFAPDDPRPWVMVEEEARGLLRPAGSGFERSYTFYGAGKYVLRVAEPGARWIASGTTWVVRERPDGVFEATGVSGGGERAWTEPLGISVEGGSVLLRVDLGGGDVRRVSVRTLLFPVWNGDVQDLWIREMRP